MLQDKWQEESAEKLFGVVNMLDTVRVTFDNGEVMTTDYNAAVGRENIAKYYMGNWFNLGVVSDDMHKVVKVEFDF